MGRTVLISVIASVFAVVGAGFAVVPGDASAKGGVALTGKPSGLIARPGSSFRNNLARRSVFLPPIVPPFNIFNPGTAPRRFSFPVSSHRRVFGRNLPASGIGVYYGAYGVSPDIVDAGECVREEVTVPAESGGERRITIRRCREIY